jgi:RecA-family ATPase
MQRDANGLALGGISPDCIVEGYLYADVAVKVAPGSTGKTTQELFEAAHIVLGRTLYGRRVLKPGRVLILTAEDSREMLVARLQRICAALE